MKENWDVGLKKLMKIKKFVVMFDFLCFRLKNIREIYERLIKRKSFNKYFREMRL